MIVRIVLRYAETGFDWDSDTIPWPIYLIDSLFWADAAFTGCLLWMMRGWRWLVAIVAVPSLCVTAVLTITGGMWIEGTYF
jgi:hypothetical protein